LNNLPIVAIIYLPTVNRVLSTFRTVKRQEKALFWAYIKQAIHTA